MTDSSTTTATQDQRYLSTYYIANRSAAASAESMDIDRKTLEAYGYGEINALIKHLAQELDDCFEPGWDGYDASAITSGALYRCANFLCGFASNAIRAEITPEPDGEIALEWYADEDFNLSLSFGNRQLIPYSCFLGKERHYGVIDTDERSPEIHWWLGEISERHFRKNAGSD